MSNTNDELYAAWENWKRVANRPEDICLLWLLRGAIRRMATELERAEDEVLRAERFQEALAVGRLGYRKGKHDGSPESETRVEQALRAVELDRAELRLLLALAERVQKAGDARWAQDIAEHFRSRLHPKKGTLKRGGVK